MTNPHLYCPPPPAALIRVTTCDPRSYTFRETHTATAQHLRGRRWLHIPATAHRSLFTAHWTYTFSAKERDPETGLSYFGSRYYSSDLSIWLSVDPMAAKYPSLSPYTYCANNPVKLVDPNGEEMWIPEVTDNGDIRLLYEEGDDFQSLTDFLGVTSVSFQKGKLIKCGATVMKKVM